MSKRTDAMTMTAEANTAKVSNTQLTLSRRGPPAYRKPTQTRAGRQRKQMIADFVAALGGPDRVTAIEAENVRRAVDLTMLAQTARAELAAGKTSIDDVVKLENAADRAVRRLNLPAPNAAATAAPSLAEYWAARHEKEG